MNIRILIVILLMHNIINFRLSAQVYEDPKKKMIRRSKSLEQLSPQQKDLGIPKSNSGDIPIISRGFFEEEKLRLQPLTRSKIDDKQSYIYIYKHNQLDILKKKLGSKSGMDCFQANKNAIQIFFEYFTTNEKIDVQNSFLMFCELVKNMPLIPAFDTLQKRYDTQLQQYSPERNILGLMIEQKQRELNIALFNMIKTGKWKKIILLIKEGADLNSYFNNYQYVPQTPLMRSLSILSEKANKYQGNDFFEKKSVKKQIEIVKLLLRPPFLFLINFKLTDAKKRTYAENAPQKGLFVNKTFKEVFQDLEKCNSEQEVLTTRLSFDFYNELLFDAFEKYDYFMVKKILNINPSHVNAVKIDGKGDTLLINILKRIKKDEKEKIGLEQGLLDLFEFAIALPDIDFTKKDDKGNLALYWAEKCKTILHGKSLADQIIAKASDKIFKKIGKKENKF